MRAECTVECFETSNALEIELDADLPQHALNRFRRPNYRRVFQHERGKTQPDTILVRWESGRIEKAADGTRIEAVVRLHPRLVPVRLRRDRPVLGPAVAGEIIDDD